MSLSVSLECPARCQAARIAHYEPLPTASELLSSVDGDYQSVHPEEYLLLMLNIAKDEYGYIVPKEQVLSLLFELERIGGIAYQHIDAFSNFIASDLKAAPIDDGDFLDTALVVIGFIIIVVIFLVIFAYYASNVARV